MKRVILTFLAVLFGVCALPAQTAFQTYTDPNGKFTINFPGTPSVSQPQQQTGKQKYTEYHLLIHDDQAYALMIADYETSQENTVLDDFAVSEAQTCGGGYSIVDHDPWENHKAFTFILDCFPASNEHDETAMFVHIVVDGNRIYQTMIGITEAEVKASPNNAERGIGFIKSFHLTGAK
jgi:hypothetical protein